MRDNNRVDSGFSRKLPQWWGLAASSRCRSRPRQFLLPETHDDEEPSNRRSGRRPV